MNIRIRGQVDAQTLTELRTKAAAYEASLHTMMVAEGYRLVSHVGDDRIYEKVPARTRRQEIQEALDAFLKEQGFEVDVFVSEGVRCPHGQCVYDEIEYVAEITGAFKLRFDQMPKFAEIFGTEHLNFGQTQATSNYYSYEGESAKFCITAVVKKTP